MSLDATLSALADPNRRQVVELLRVRPRPAGELARATGLPGPAMSRALKSLKAAGIVSDSHPEHDARVRVYELRSAPMRELRDWLEQTEAMWADQLLALKAHVEQDG